MGLSREELNHIDYSEAKAQFEIEEAIRYERFRTGKISLPSLNTKILLQPNQFYKIEYVEDMAKAMHELFLKYGGDRVILHPKKGHEPVGICLSTCLDTFGKERSLHLILIEKDLNDITRIYVHAHEHGHLIYRLGYSELIYQQCRSPDDLKAKIINDEEFANMCGYIALKRKGHNLRHMTYYVIKKEQAKRMKRIAQLIHKYV